MANNIVVNNVIILADLDNNLSNERKCIKHKIKMIRQGDDPNKQKELKRLQTKLDINTQLVREVRQKGQYSVINTPNVKTKAREHITRLAIIAQLIKNGGTLTNQNNKQVYTLIGKCLVDRNTFKNLYYNDNNNGKTVNSREYVIAHIEEILYINNGIAIKYDSPTWDIKYLIIKYDGVWKKFKSHKSFSKFVKSTKAVEYNYININRGRNHYTMHIDHVDFTLEALLAMCNDWYNNELLNDYSNINTNVLDGSGTINTTIKLGIKANVYDMNNLEYCSSEQNLSHGSKIEKIYGLLDKVYAFTALDELFDVVFKNNYSNATMKISVGNKKEDEKEIRKKKIIKKEAKKRIADYCYNCFEKVK